MSAQPPRAKGSSFVQMFAAAATSTSCQKDAPPHDHNSAAPSPLWGMDDAAEPPPPSLELAHQHLQARLARDPATGEQFGSTGRLAPRLSDFEFLGLGVHSYVAQLHRWRAFFVLLALLSVSSLVANGYGEELSEKQLNVVTWLFTAASLGNADSIAPAYGATELLISTLMTVFLFWALAALDDDAHRVEQKQVTPADFAVMVSGLPRDATAATIKAALENAPEVRGRALSVAVALCHRDVVLVERELRNLEARKAAYTADAEALARARAANGGTLSPGGLARLDQLGRALEGAEAEREKLMAKARAAVAALGPAGPKSAGVAFVTFADAHDAVALLEQGTLHLPALPAASSGPASPAAAYAASRPPEPSDLVWENLGSDDGLRRQVVGTCAMTALSLVGAALIGASAYLQPKATEGNHAKGKGAIADLGVMAVGTGVLLAGYLAVFLTVPVVEASFMRHTTVTGREVSQVLKLVLFQVLATLSTIGSFAADTSGAFNRDWYITGGFMLVNGMFVDLLVITCIIQGWNLMLNVGRHLVAPRCLTQHEMDLAYAGDGASGYCVDRLQLVTKFVAMAYICSAAIPLLFFVVVLVLACSILIDETNLLRRLWPAPQSDHAVVRAILVYVMPVAVTLHLLAARIFVAQLRSPSEGGGGGGGGGGGSRSLVTALWPTASFGSEDDDGVNLVMWSAVINLPLVALFVLREWRKPLCGGAAPPAATAGSSSASSDDSGGLVGTGQALVGRALAGTVWSRLHDEDQPGGSSRQGGGEEGAAAAAASTNRALAMSYTELERRYQHAGRQAELRYATPDTAKLVLVCRAAGA